MERIDQDNPFESPTAASDPSVPLESVVHLVRLGWLLPLIGLGLFGAMLLTAIFVVSTSLNFLLLMGVFLCLIGGILFTIYGMFWSQSFRTLLPHVVGGLAANFVLMTIVGGVLYLLVYLATSPYAV
ncbi:hypothetical protein [Bremerella alba]|uniref:Uncharacterized protein n=1 Tax=Bremerella alba TaxID=980252 RepID=A0A7V9A7E1_9BACT|nr:hypothetical protein [Bremerella alba]MBA2114906.1 hypothetical protein [Bremerella alba]